MQTEQQQALTTEPDDVQQHLHDVQALLERQQVVENLARAQQDEAGAEEQAPQESLAQREHLAELRQLVERLHPADIAYILEALPLDERLLVWDQVAPERDGDILLELSDAVRESLIEHMEHHELAAVAQNLEADELADLADDLPPEVIESAIAAREEDEQEQLRAALSYPEGTVGALMDFDMVCVREDVTLEVVLRYLRRFDELPSHTDKIFVVDREDQLKGILSLEVLLINDPELEVFDAMRGDNIIHFSPEDDADEAAQAFERYDLVSAPVINESGQVIGRLTIDSVVDHIREGSEQDLLNQAGLREEEDIFASVWDSLRNRWAWLAVNMITAVIASRVIGVFEHSIARLVALATLMPIVAGIGGNSGNQTTTLIVRALGVGQIEHSAYLRLLRKEVGIGLINGLVWGGFLGILAWSLYDNAELGIVMAAAMTLTLMLASLAGVTIPMILSKLGLDPALGSSVLLTAITDSGGFFIFLGLATVFLL